MGLRMSRGKHVTMKKEKTKKYNERGIRKRGMGWKRAKNKNSEGEIRNGENVGYEPSWGGIVDINYTISIQ